MTLPTMSEDTRKLNEVALSQLGRDIGILSGRSESKYLAIKTGHYASRKEARYAADLALRQKAGEISFWLEQVPFRLPGDVVHRLDFAVFTARSDVAFSVDWVEVKGKDLAMGRLKRKQVQELYGIRITLV